MSNLDIIDIDENNINDYIPGPTCFLNIKHKGAQVRVEWLKKRFKDGLKIKLILPEGEKKPAGFIEYITGENAWRAVTADGYLFIHCIWMYPNKNKNKGYASTLLNECIKDANKQSKAGVAVITSEGPFMAGKALFEKNGFESIEEVKPFNLMLKKLRDAPLPHFNNWEKKLREYKGLNMVYSNQCPWVVRSIDELSEVAEKYKLKLNVSEMKTAREAQNAPTIYASFNLIHNGKLLSDHYISKTRFENIIKKEILKK